jgi:hypothetical protein
VRVIRGDVEAGHGEALCRLLAGATVAAHAAAAVGPDGHGKSVRMEQQEEEEEEEEEEEAVLK